MNTQEIIAELESLTSKDFIDIGGLFPETQFRYEPIVHYLNSLISKSKPEAALQELFKNLIIDVLKIRVQPEVNIGDGFVDFTIKEQNGNPILIELKSLFHLDKGKSIIRAESLHVNSYKQQITKYLRKNEYVILTNLKDAYLFNREAIVQFESFEHLSFLELLQRFIESENFWDSIRRIEDQRAKVDLDKEFFEDLKKWFDEFNNIEFDETNGLLKKELIVLLLNKIIFIKTLEDFGLIDYKFLEDEYESTKAKWQPKGSIKVFNRFFDEIEKFCEDYYDTELFTTNVWDCLIKTESNVESFQKVFERLLGLDTWSQTFGKGMIHYNYRFIDEDIFGKAYETFIAEERKDSGIYYTPRPITHYMAKKLVDTLFIDIVNQILTAVDKNVCDYATANKLIESMQKIKIIDITSGSGSFMIKVFREIYFQYKRIDEATAWIEQFKGSDLFDLPDNIKATIEFRKRHHFGETGSDALQLISKIILRHIYAVDKDERALDTAKTNIWKEAIKLNPRLYNYRRLNGKTTHILPNLGLNFVCGDSLTDLPIEKQIQILSTEYKEVIIQLHSLRKKYLSNPFSPEVMNEILQQRKILYQRLLNEIHEQLRVVDRPIFICADFFYCYFDEEGNVLTQNEQGFDGTISNPPWETIKPIRKEFAKQAKYQMNILEFDEWFEKKLESNIEFKKQWESYQTFYEGYNSFLTNRYQYQGSGDPNFFKYFIERNIEILKLNGLMMILVPSGIQTDIGSTSLRKFLMITNSLIEMSSFENKGYEDVINGNNKHLKLFPDVHPQFKFTILNARKTQQNQMYHTFDAKFYMHHPNELVEKEPIKYDVKMIEQFSQKNFSIMEFRSESDYILCSKMRGNLKLFEDFGYSLRTEFHMTNDSNLFYSEKQKLKLEKKKFLPLYEGKMIHQFNSIYSSNKYWLEEKEAREIFVRKEIQRIAKNSELEADEIKNLFLKKKYLLDYETFRLCYREIGSSTNERTLISSIVPPKVFCNHKLIYLVNCKYNVTENNFTQILVEPIDLIFFMSLFNSLTLNYYVRNKVSTTVSMYMIYELPIPVFSEAVKRHIAELGFTLLWQNGDKKLFTPLKKKLGISSIPTFEKGDGHTVDVRAELEILIARDLYKLSFDDWKYLTSTFVQGGESASKRELDQIIVRSLEKYTS